MRKGRGVWRITGLSILLLFNQACQRAVVAPSTVVAVEPVTSTVRLPSDFADSLYRGVTYPQVVEEFYAKAKFKPAWLEMPALRDSMITCIRGARFYGLRSDDYHGAELGGAAAQPLRQDVLLTDAFVAMASELRRGRGYNAEPDTLLLALLRSSLHTGNLEGLRSQQPSYTGYRKLIGAMRQVLDSLPPEGRASALAGEAVDEATDASLTCIETNLQRWREESQPFRGLYIVVNVPAFMLYVMSDDSVVMTSKVIVGESATETPSLSSRIERIVFYPYWHVPRKIAVKEYLPAIQRDRGVIEANNFDVLDRNGALLPADSVPWDTFSEDYFPVSLRQREGKENALGVIKFEFRNPYAVFLHDTNNRRLFKATVRTFSHGCIRMEKAEALAHFLVTGDLDSKSKEVSKWLEAKERHTLHLRKPVPIYVRYFTAEVRAGRLFLFPDVYEQDKAALIR